MSSPAGPRSVSGAHIKALDGLRFFAFLGVFIYHALQNNAKLAHWAGYGALGVQIFFVLSGFLIGGILLEQRAQAGVPLWTRLKTFYIRRILRIFPLYYLALLIIALLPLIGITVVGGREYLLWNALYLSNVKMYLDHQMMGGLSHLWSLSVEEHFYLIAPFVVLTMTNRRLAGLFLAIWMGCALARVGFVLRHDTLADKLSPFQFDCLTVGIAAAMIQSSGAFLGLRSRGAARLAIACAVCFVLMALARERLHAAPIQMIAAALGQWLLSVAAAGLILALWNDHGGLLARFFSLKPFAYLGKISYGLYVYHLPCLVIVTVALAGIMKHGSALPALALTIAVSMASWHLYEKPINDLKRHFSYASSPKVVLRAKESGEPMGTA